MACCLTVAQNPGRHDGWCVRCAVSGPVVFCAGWWHTPTQPNQRPRCTSCTWSRWRLMEKPSTKTDLAGYACQSGVGQSSPDRFERWPRRRVALRIPAGTPDSFARFVVMVGAADKKAGLGFSALYPDIPVSPPKNRRMKSRSVLNECPQTETRLRSETGIHKLFYQKASTMRN